MTRAARRLGRRLGRLATSRWVWSGAAEAVAVGLAASGQVRGDGEDEGVRRARAAMALIQAKEAGSRPMATMSSARGRRRTAGLAGGLGRPKSRRDWREPGRSRSLERPARRKTAERIRRERRIAGGICS